MCRNIAWYFQFNSKLLFTNIISVIDCSIIYYFVYRFVKFSTNQNSFELRGLLSIVHYLGVHCISMVYRIVYKSLIWGNRRSIL